MFELMKTKSERFYIMFNEPIGEQREHGTCRFAFVDKEICKILKLSCEQYREVMKREFNANSDEDNNIIFMTENQAKSACDFLNQSYKMLSW